MIAAWVRISLIYLFIAGILGCLLRYHLFAPIEGVNFRHFLHAHSHVAILGWLFNILFSVLVFVYVPEKAKKYALLFWLIQITVVGMLVTFPIQGYAFASILFSTLHIFLSYWFAIKIWKDIRPDLHINTQVSIPLVKWSLFFMVLSSLGPFSLGFLMAKGLSDTIWYNLSIYFYLHFQYNGWLTFAVFGLFFNALELDGFLHEKSAKAFLWLMVLAAIPSYSLSALWTQPPAWVVVVGYASAGIQIIALAVLWFLILKTKTAFRKFTVINFLFLLSFIAFNVKVLMQFMSAFPLIADLAYKVRNFTIGYLHIVFVGFVSFFIIACIARMNLISLKKPVAKLGMTSFIIGFILSEAIIFLGPAFVMWDLGLFPFGDHILFFVSVLMPLGILGVLLGGISKEVEK